MQQPFREMPVLIGREAPVPDDRPFTTAQAVSAGVSRYRLGQWVKEGLLRHPLRGVFHAAQLVDDLDLRIEILKLVVPAPCVVTDRTAAWLWGATMALAPNDHLVTPPVSVFCPPGHRLRNGLVASGERQLRSGDVAELRGLRVTTPLRTACDLGRLLHRDQALAAMDALTRLGAFTPDRLVEQTGRFKGYRGVVQLRCLASYVDPGAASPGESVLRLRWLDVGLPRPQCQVPVPSPSGGLWWLDMGLPELRFAAEYDGEAFHTEADRVHDDARRDWMRRVEGWTVVVARRHDVHGPHQDIHRMLLEGVRVARAALGKR